jgi:cytochrome c-type biogenesis protein CcmH/NrfG
MATLKKIPESELTPDLFGKLLEHALNLEHIKTKLDGFDRLDDKITALDKTVMDYKLTVEKQFGLQEVKIAKIQEKVGTRATIISVIAGVVAIVTAFLIAYFSK